MIDRSLLAGDGIAYVGSKLQDDQDRAHGCYQGVVYIGHMVEHDGEEVEVIVAVPCRRCSDTR